MSEIDRSGFKTGLFGSYVHSYNYFGNANFRLWPDGTIIRTTPGWIARDWELITTGSAQRREDGPDVHSKYCIEVQSSAGEDVEFGQFIRAEDAQYLSNQIVTLQFHQKYMTGTLPLRTRLYSVDTYNDSTSNRTLVAQGESPISGAVWEYREFSFDLTAHDTTNGLWVVFEVEADSVIFRLSRPQINLGDRATPFQFKPLADELRPDDSDVGMYKYPIDVVGGETEIDLTPHTGSARIDQINVLMSGAILQETYDYTWDPDTKIITFLGGYRPRAEDTCVVQAYAGIRSSLVSG